MNLLQADRKHATLSLSYDEIYVLLQCVAQAEQLDESETAALMNRSRAQLRSLADELNAIKKAMRSG